MSVILEMEFDSQEHLEAFTSWLSNSGEQDYYNQGDYEDEENKHLYRTGLDYSQHNKVIVKEYPKDVQ